MVTSGVFLAAASRARDRERMCCWHLVGRARDAAKLLSPTGQTLPAKNYLTTVSVALKLKNKTVKYVDFGFRWPRFEF